MTYCETCGHGMCVCPKKPAPASPNESFVENMRRRTVERDENDHLFVIPIAEVRQLLAEYDKREKFSFNHNPDGKHICPCCGSHADATPK